MHRAEYAKHSINRIPYQDFPINRRLYMPFWRGEGGEVESAGNINNNTAVLLNYIVKKQNNVL